MLEVSVTYKSGSDPWKCIKFDANEVLGYDSRTISIGTLSDFNTWDEFTATIRNVVSSYLMLDRSVPLTIGKIEFI